MDKIQKSVVLAISSSGGHWEQLMMLQDAFIGHQVVYVTTLEGLPQRNGISDAYIVDDCNRDTRIRNIKVAWQILKIIRRHKPRLVISTGAAPGIIAIAIGRMFSAKTVWIDSVANSERLSLSGSIAGYIAHIQLTQWRHLARDRGPHFAGSVL